VWAWKKGRAKNVARLVDRLMMLLPDEGRYFEKYGLQCDFVGHPVVERIAQADLDPDAFRKANAIPAASTVISVLPGSRRSEIKRLLPILKDAVGRVAKAVEATAVQTATGGGEMAEEAKAGRHATDEGDALCHATDWSEAGCHTIGSGKMAANAKTGGRERQIYVVVPTVAGVEEDVRRGFEDFDLPVRIVTGTANRYNAFAISDIALAKSGTVSLELAAVGVPHLIAYKFNALSNFAAKMLVKVRFANLLNIIAGREIIPEFVLDNCRADLIAEGAQQLLTSQEKSENQVIEAREVMQKLRLPDLMPSDAAARVVLAEASGRGVLTGTSE
jgi:lipid-A-disaccharide synthase